MNVFAKISAVCSILLAALPLNARVFGVTADGAWDCKDNNGVNIGAVVVADTSYAFIKPDGKVGPYGQLKQVAQADVDLPNFVALSGPLKDDIGAIGLSMRGPKGHTEDTSGELFLNIIVTENNLIECTIRKAPAP
jgi:hypothetical protein